MSIAEAHAALNQPGGPFEIAEETIRGIRLKVWKNAPSALGDVLALTARFADRDALVYEGERVTYHGCRAAAATLARRLVDDGVRQGDHVALLVRNLPEWPMAFWGAVLAGAIVTPLNAWWTGPELEYGPFDSGASVAIMDVERWERVREHVDACPTLRRIYVARSTDDVADPRVVRLEQADASRSWSPPRWAARSS